MDLVPGQAGSQGAMPAPFTRDNINALLTALAQVDTVVGQPVPKVRMAGGMVGITVPRERLVDAARTLRDTLGFEMLVTISGVDMVEHRDAIYHFRSLRHNWLLQVRVAAPSERAEIPSLVSLYASANWLEREVYDLSGIAFPGHPDLRRILLDETFIGHPLLKDFRSTPTVVHDRATTQVDAIRAVSGERQRGQERIVLKKLGQGDQERLHPGMMTFGSEAVFMETGQGIGTGPNAMHGYTVKTDEDTGPTMKPEEG